MINPEDDIYIEPRTSCTKDEAIAKLLGWMQGDIRRKFTNLSFDGITEESLQHMHTLEGSIWNLLTEQRANAQLAYSDAFDAQATEEFLYEKEKDILKWQEIISKAKSYQRDIDDELAKGSESALRIDKLISDESGLTHISLSSLDSWTLKEYGISTENYLNPKAVEPDYISDVRDEKGRLTNTSINSLFLTLGVLINAFVDVRKDLAKKDTNKPIVSELAIFLSDRAKPYGKLKPIRGQNDERIKDRIEEAMKIYNSAMGISDDVDI